MNILTVFTSFVFAHALTDWCWQPDVMGLCKNFNLSKRSGTYLKPYLDTQKIVPWYYWLTAHALAQGAGVAYVTYLFTNIGEFSVLLGILESYFHWMIDHGKCEGIYGIHVDQGLHLLCKLVLSILVVLVVTR